LVVALRATATETQMFSLFQCCRCDHDSGPSGELKVVQLSSDDLEVQLVQPVHLLTRQDSFDMTATPRTNCKIDRGKRGLQPITPRQRSFKERVKLPAMRRYPVPVTCSADDPEDLRRQELLRVYQDFVIELHKGLHMTQLTSHQDYSDIHCQILEDLQTLNVDQGNGCIIEFPLSAVSKVYRIVKNDDKWYSAGSLNGPTPMPPLPLSNAEHIVVVEFMRRKLAFVFNEIEAAQRFLMCMELLIRRASECRQEQDAWRNLSSHKKGNGQMSHMFSKEQFRQDGASMRMSPRSKETPLCRLSPGACLPNQAP